MTDPDVPREIGERVFPTGYLHVEGWGTRHGLMPCAICGAVVLIGETDLSLRHIHYHIERDDL